MPKKNPNNKKLIYCVGNNLATIIGAYEIAKSGYRVKLFTDNGNLGGIFSGIKIEKYNFDIGMVLIEKYTNKNSQKIKKRISNNAWLNYGVSVSKWLNSQLKLQKVNTPEVFVFGKRYPDYIISNKLEILKNFSIKLPNISNIKKNLHASNKEKKKIYEKLTYAIASRYNHGFEFHNKLIEPFVKKVTSYGSKDFLAKYHRFSWVPLYYPETIKSACLGQNYKLKEYNFWTSSFGFSGHLIKQIIKKISKMRNIEIIKKKITSLRLSKNILTVDNQKIKIKNKVLLGLNTLRTLELLQSKPQKIRNWKGINFTIGFAIIHRSALKYQKRATFIVDNNFGAFRVTNQDAIAKLNPKWQRVSIEANSDILKKKYPDFSLDKAIKIDLIRFLKIKNLNYLKLLKVINVKNGLYLPTKGYVNNKCKLKKKVLSFTSNSAYLTGDLLGYGSSSMNNQIMQALNFKNKLNGQKKRIK